MSDGNSTPETIVIQLTQGQFCIVDLVDSDLCEFKWYSAKGYAVRQPSRRSKAVLMHRIILERKLGRPLKSGEFCDHINGERADNRRSNLRIASKQQNAMNQRVHRNNKSGVAGVSWNKERGLWEACIRANGRHIFLGCFHDLSDAAKARKNAEVKYFGVFRRDSTP